MNIMTRLSLTVDLLCADKRAVTAIEYVLIASIIALAIITGVKAIGLSLSNTFSFLAGHL
jgi:Flp pilus assembly pilin Flp